MKKMDFFKTELQDWCKNKNKLNAILCIACVAASCVLARAFTNTFSVQISSTYLIGEATQRLKMALQDTNPKTSLFHCAQGLTYLKLARRLASDSSLEKTSGVNVSELERILNETKEKKQD